LEKNGDLFSLIGELTIKGISREISFETEFGGQITDPYGQSKAGFTILGNISRKEFGLLWNATTEAGQIVVSDHIRINCSIQLIRTDI
jgi:polyisoprenoid-binding protein YceI